MVQIHEYQYEENNKENYQERIIEYSSWEDYCNNISTFDGVKNMKYPSLPRQTFIFNIIKEENKISLKFVHRLYCQDMIHEATLL